MTLPASGPISLTQVMAELRTINPGRAFPISLGDSDMRALAGVPTGPISLSQLHGKTSIPSMSVVGHSSINNSYISTTRGGIATATPSVTASGGSGNFSYQWTVTSGNGSAGLNNATLAGCSLTANYGKTSSGFFDIYLDCRVTDNVYGTVVVVQNVEAYATWEP